MTSRRDTEKRQFSWAMSKREVSKISTIIDYTTSAARIQW
jgi:hypothetical protein